MKSQILFSGKNRKHISSLSSAELAQKVVMVNYNSLPDNFCIFICRELFQHKASQNLITVEIAIVSAYAFPSFLLRHIVMEIGSKKVGSERLYKRMSLET